MARNYTTTSTAIWRDPNWRQLAAADQHLLWLLGSQPNISAAGMLPMTVGRWAAMASDLTPAGIRESLGRLGTARLVAVDEATEEVLVRSFVRDDNGYGNSKRRPVIRAAAGEIESQRLRQVLAVELDRLGLPPEWTGEAPVEPDAVPDGLSDALSEGASEGSSGQAGSGVPDTPTDGIGQNVYSQVDRLSDTASDGTSGSERVVVTKGPYIETSTLIPQSAVHPIPQATTDSVAETSADPSPQTDRQIETNPTAVAVDVKEKPVHASTPVAPAAPRQRQKALFPTTAVRIPEPLQIIIDDLKIRGYTITRDEADQIRALVVTQNGAKVGTRYLRGIASNSGFAGFYADLRREQSARIEAEIQHLRDTQPECEHGTAAGRTPHPTNGQPLCPACRNGTPAPPDTRPTTPPAVAAAIDTYRRNYRKRLRADQLVTLTQQATGLHARGATLEQLVTLAQQAATAGIGLFTAALQGGTTT